MIPVFPRLKFRFLLNYKNKNEFFVFYLNQKKFIINKKKTLKTQCNTNLPLPYYFWLQSSVSPRQATLKKARNHPRHSLVFQEN